MLQAYTLEILTRTGWRRNGDTFWTLEDAREASKMLIKRKRAKRVRILPVEVSLDPVAEIPERLAEATK